MVLLRFQRGGEEAVAESGLGRRGATQRFCTACYTGDYPCPVEAEMDKFIMEQRRNRVRRPVSDLVHEDTQRRLL